MAKEGQNGGKGTRRLAIRKKGIDIARLIPGNMDGDRLDVKIIFPSHEFEVYTYRLLHVNPDVLIPEASEGKNITYHLGADGKDVVINVKNASAADGERRYKDLPLTEIVPPSRDTIVPLPLLKIEIPNGFDEGVKPSKHKKKPGKIEFDMEPECDVVEVFMTSHEWDFNKMEKMLPDLMGLLTSTPFETWSSNKITVNQSKVAVIPHGEPRDRMAIVNFGAIDFVLLQYPQPTMPLPQVLRATFVENALAEPIMLHMKTMLTRDRQNFLIGCASEKDICMPDFVRANNPRYQDVWVRALRTGTVSYVQYKALTHRVDRGRVELLKALRKRESELDRDVAEVARTVKAKLADGRSVPGGDSFSRHRTFAESLGRLPTVIHSTRIVSEAAGIDEVYSFLTIGDDIDVHLDIARLCDLASAPLKEMVVPTEGRPFEDGLAGMRTALKLMGFRCLPTETAILLPSGGSGGEGSVVVPLYVQMGIVEGYRNLRQDQKDSLRAIVGQELSDFLAALDSGLPFQAGLHVMDVTPNGELGGHAQYRSERRGMLEENRWAKLASSAYSFTNSYRDFKSNVGPLSVSFREYMERCSKASVAKMIGDGKDNDTIVAEANRAALQLATGIRRLPASVASFMQVAIDSEGFPDLQGVTPQQRLSLHFLSDLALYCVNSDGLFSGVTGTMGIGEWLWCSREKMLRWDGWGEDCRHYLEGLAGQYVDLEPIVDEAGRAVLDIRDAAMLSRAGELIGVCEAYGALKEEYGVKGDLFVFRIPEGATTENAVLAEYIDVQHLALAVDDLRVAVERQGKKESVPAPSVDSIQPVAFDVEGRDSEADNATGQPSD